MRAWVVALAMLCAGCAENRSFSDMMAGHRVRGDGAGAIVHADSAADAWPLAIGHCAHFNRSAQFAGRRASGVYAYRCVAAD
jgi:hypothetical protein